MFSEEEVTQAQAAAGTVVGEPISTEDMETARRTLRAVIRAVMAKTAGLLAARGGTMTAEELEEAFKAVEWASHRGASAIREYLAAQGARAAALEKELNEARQQIDALGKNWELACAKADEQRERAEAAEQERLEEVGNRRAWQERAATHLKRAEAAEERLQQLREGIQAIVSQCAEMVKVAALPPRCDCAARNIACLHWMRRYPCSPTCTHDDAKTPGHPERVRERSEGFIAAAKGEG